MRTPMAPWRASTQRAWHSLYRKWRALRRQDVKALMQLMPTVFPARPASASAIAERLPAELHIEDHHIVVNMRLPGEKVDDLLIDIHARQICVSGEWLIEQEKDNGICRTVRCGYQRLRRKLSLPHQIDPKESQIHCSNGLLRIDLPRVKPATGSKPDPAGN